MNQKQIKLKTSKFKIAKDNEQFPNGEMINYSDVTCA